MEEPKRGSGMLLLLVAGGAGFVLLLAVGGGVAAYLLLRPAKVVNSPSKSDVVAQANKEGTVVVIQGPRFSTRAESRWFRSAGWEVVNMTQYPEAVLARELGMCYANISLVTDYDSGLEGFEGIEPVSMEIVLKVLDDNLDRLRALLFRAIPAIPAERNCPCGAAALDPGALPS